MLEGMGVLVRGGKTGDNCNSIMNKIQFFKKANNLIKKWAKDLNKLLINEDIQMANKHRKNCSQHMVIKEMQKKPTRYH